MFLEESAGGKSLDWSNITKSFKIVKHYAITATSYRTALGNLNVLENCPRKPPRLTELPLEPSTRGHGTHRHNRISRYFLGVQVQYLHER